MTDIRKTKCERCNVFFVYEYRGRGRSPRHCSKCVNELSQNVLVKGHSYNSICTSCGKEFSWIYAGKGPALTRCECCPVQKHSVFHKKKGHLQDLVCVECGATFAYEYAGRGPNKTRCKSCLLDMWSKRGKYRRKMDSDYTLEDFVDAIKAFDHCCAYCCKQIDFLDFEMDHFIPVKLGGKGTRGNIVPSCRQCNARKNAHHPKDFLSSVDYHHISDILATLE